MRFAEGDRAILAVPEQADNFPFVPAIVLVTKASTPENLLFGPHGRQRDYFVQVGGEIITVMDWQLQKLNPAMEPAAMTRQKPETERKFVKVLRINRRWNRDQGDAA